MKIFKRGKNNIEKQNNLLHELEWAHVYHDSIRGRDYLENLPINVGRFAGNYPFFYVLNRILHDFKPKSIIEFGLGESSKFISTCIENYLLTSEHLIIEQSEEWKSYFLDNFKFSKRSEVLILPQVLKKIKGYNVNCYSELVENVQRKYDLYVIDGPHGSGRFSRFNIVELAQNFTKSDEFIILMDDCNRIGELDTFNSLIELFEKKNISISTGSYKGVKELKLISSYKFRYSISL